jgi:hypothetical protein
MSMIDKVLEAAENSELRRYRWLDRGRAPLGYIKGMAVAYAAAVQKLGSGDAVQRAAAAALGTDNRDALAYYKPELDALGAPTATEGDRLRAVYSLMFGLGMRESSGKHCEGRDQSANNVSALTAEAGLFQTSFNSVSAHPLLRTIFNSYDGSTELQGIFSEGVSCRPSSWMNYGTGEGVQFQALSKACPAFAVDYTAVALRVLRRHWGPINRKRAELRRESFRLLREVEAIVTGAAGAPLISSAAVAPLDSLTPTVRALVMSALAEWNAFGRSTRSLSNEWRIGGDEADEPYTSYVGRYWRAVGNSGWDGDTPKPWSAAFISWLFQNAGVDETIFKPNAGHADYIRPIYQNPGGLRLNPPTETLRVGDLIWNARQGSVADHAQAVAKLNAGTFFVSHCDIVVELGDGWCHSIGGNVSNQDPGGSVTRSTWKLDNNGRLADRRKVWIGVVSNRL